MTIFLDVIAIFLFLFLFLPIYKEPTFVIKQFYTEGDFSLYKKGSDYYHKVIITETGNIAYNIGERFKERVGMGIKCTGWCENILEEKAAKESFVYITGKSYGMLSTYLLQNCIGQNTKPCDTKEIVIQGKEILIPE